MPADLRSRGAKKSIVNKFIGSEPVSAMVWPRGQPGSRFIVYGTSTGKIRIGNTKSNKSNTVCVSGAGGRVGGRAAQQA